MGWKWIQLKVAELGVKHKQVTDVAGLDYATYMKVIHGYRKAPEGFEEAVRSALERLASVEVQLGKGGKEEA